MKEAFEKKMDEVREQIKAAQAKQFGGSPQDYDFPKVVESNGVAGAGEESNGGKDSKAGAVTGKIKEWPHNENVDICWRIP